ncbi:MAG: V-type ATPase subunit [Candidatus Diapherotrites archaeon]|nr:V-type ATPase subunit [Candidatus Diapherotrites archaeon]
MSIEIPIIGFFENSLAVRSVKYGYSNARTKALRGTLLSKKEIDSLAEAKNIQEIIGALQRTAYSEDLISEAVAFSRADLVEIAASRNFSRTLKKLIKISPKGTAEKIKKIFERYDVQNIKNLLLGIHLNEPKEKIRLLLVQSPLFSYSQLNALAEQKSVKELVEKLKGTEYFSPLDRALLKYSKSGDILDMTVQLENQYYKKFAAKSGVVFGIGKTIQSILRAEIDAKNIMAILRAKNAGFPSEKALAFLVEGGKISKEEIKEMSDAKSVQDAVLAQKVFDLKKPLEDYKNDPSLSHFENSIETKIVKAGLKEFQRSVLSISAIVGFLFLKEEETKNIRKIIRLKEAGFLPEAIKEFLVIA